MARYVCQECGYEAIRWLGRCPDCGTWSKMIEEAGATTPVRGGKRKTATQKVQALPLTEVLTNSEARFSTGSTELDRLLGGGAVHGATILVGGEPGIGKSTLLLQVASFVAGRGLPVLYVSGEESLQQVKLRAERLGAIQTELLVASETDADGIEATVRELKPQLIVIDSVQTLSSEALRSAPGSVSQVRECAYQLTRAAKDTNRLMFLVGHITKSGELAGPKVLEHMVDVVLYFEGERDFGHRILRCVKNRFGPTHEIALFEMSGEGLKDVDDASRRFLAERVPGVTGSAVVVSMEGGRPLCVELQALFGPPVYGNPRRTVRGLDANRVALLLAVLEQRLGMHLGDREVYVKVMGGMMLAEPAVDLPLALALASAFRDKPVPEDLVACGEVGLAGEVRAVQRLEERLREAARMGFRRFVAPSSMLRGRGGSGMNLPTGLEIIPVSNLQEALSLLDQEVPNSSRGTGA